MVVEEQLVVKGHVKVVVAEEEVVFLLKEMKVLQKLLRFWLLLEEVFLEEVKVFELWKRVLLEVMGLVC